MTRFQLWFLVFVGSVGVAAAGVFRALPWLLLIAAAAAAWAATAPIRRRCRSVDRRHGMGFGDRPVERADPLVGSTGSRQCHYGRSDPHRPTSEADRESDSFGLGCWRVLVRTAATRERCSTDECEHP